MLEQHGDPTRTSTTAADSMGFRSFDPCECVEGIIESHLADGTPSVKQGLGVLPTLPLPPPDVARENHLHMERVVDVEPDSLGVCQRPSSLTTPSWILCIRKWEPRNTNGEVRKWRLRCGSGVEGGRGWRPEVAYDRCSWVWGGVGRWCTVRERESVRETERGDNNTIDSLHNTQRQSCHRQSPDVSSPPSSEWAGDGGGSEIVRRRGPDGTSSH
jgi:hypothetical protein